MNTLSSSLTEQTQRINNYLNDETKLYQDWYQQIFPPSDNADSEAIAKMPSVAELKTMAKQWWQRLYGKNKTVVRKLFCKTPLRNGETACVWWKRIRDVSHESRDLIIAIMVDLALAPIIHPSHVEVSVTVMVTNHFLDMVCEGEECAGPPE